MRNNETKPLADDDGQSLERPAGFRTLFRQVESLPEYWVEGAIIGFTEELSRVMAAQGISRAELARRLGTSPAYVTKVMRGNANFTLASMVKLARACGHTIRVQIEPARPDQQDSNNQHPSESGLGRTIPAPVEGEPSR